VSAPPRPDSEGPAWLGTLRLLRGAVAVQVWSGMVAWRWLLAAAVFGVSSYLAGRQQQVLYINLGIQRAVDAWDLFPAMVIDFVTVFVVFSFGFLVFVVDSYHRGRDQGTLSLSFVRMPSRPLYWLGTMGSVGIAALLYVTLVLVVSWLVGLIAFPPSTFWPALPRAAEGGMYPPWHMPLLPYLLIFAAYTVWALWVAGCVVAFFSVFVRRKALVLAFVVLWNALSFITPDILVHMGAFQILNVGFLVGMFKHHIKDPYPMEQFFAITGAALVLMALVGSWKMRREEP
jgi:hypothetical protein